MDEKVLLEYFRLYGKGDYRQATNRIYAGDAYFWNTQIEITGRKVSPYSKETLAILFLVLKAKIVGSAVILEPNSLLKKKVGTFLDKQG